MPQPASPASKNPLWTALGFAWELGYAIAAPLVVFAIAGRFGDRYFGTGPLLLILGILCALAVSVLWMFRKIRAMAEEIDTIAPAKDIPHIP